ncbi:MAG: hypothetical protein UV99_C0020G0009 [Parcubacteria group bacterium GW2011_GWC1_43_61]|nr:MAG: hypothetical protein UU33_C0001G0246 [Candidatus Azambacteria bacterium GW2011_GWF1_41_10]KKS49279.1 MAG: hypothetical protein UV14_C0001G0024 [Candidatus Azambacteria bacterium GW2011_GWF2_42_22]KKT03141.1 MAG: hypothetical protein UV81_C0003G0008 [Candidatus Azambacteria bacterium GW2011_GWD1_43_18]KKT16215.1 MAG: hypothetical protein UV99_C0020G0009 [Parcubacteria group bacterium GW2011_GWC1_43_61]OGD41190.1 MAG: hypothetical protein A3K28_01385 [Candidatus Azambacteria bacterium RIF
METMKFGEPEASQEGENRKNTENNEPAPKAPERNNGVNNDGKRKKKLIAAGGILVVLILAVAGWQYWQYTQTPYYQQMKAVKMIEKSLKESEKWGGKTPEETVALFTDAVKKGDFELAGKYGDEEIKSELEQMKTDGKIEQLIKWLKTGELREISGFGGNDFNMTIKENGQEIWILSMHKSDNGIWKIDEF